MADDTATIKDHARRRAMFENRLDGIEANVCGYKAAFQAFERMLLRFGGWAVVPPLEADDLLKLLYAEGGLFPIRDLVYVEMEPSACHSNVVEWYLDQDDETAGICTGYALSEDGLWRQHSWGMKNGAIVETTAPRTAYYGISHRPTRDT
jgi:hypothetical protein